MGLEVVQLPLGAFQSNCYVVRRAGAEEAVVVDPGWPGEGGRVLDALEGARCAAILVTHGDLDHVGAVAELAGETGAPVHVPEAERDSLERPADYRPYGGSVRPEAHVPEVGLRGDETLELAGVSFRTIPVPGHTSGHVAFAVAGCVFSGDVLFAGSVGRTDRPDGDWQALLASVARLMELLPPDTVVYPGHGPATTLERELRSNPFLAELRAATP
ncbi:MAG TPA: MBL fold metallo-hydrolase [Gaiellaceae bacterium]|nr:MBL fold metallo-hydrolase [Gaiellaceae bacterium]